MIESLPVRQEGTAEVSVFIESRIEFDFTSAISAVPHDARGGGQGNSIWAGVDFCIEDPPDWI